MPKQPKKSDDYYKEVGKRLKKCRNIKGLSTVQAGLKANYSESYISQLESGKKIVDRDKAQLFAELYSNIPAYRINPAFILCETDIMIIEEEKSISNNTIVKKADIEFLQYLMAAGHKLLFYVAPLRGGKKPKEKSYGRYTAKIYDFDKGVTLNQLKDVSLSDSHCKLCKGEMLSDVIIRSVMLDDLGYSFVDFAFTINRLYDYINFTLNNMTPFKLEYDSLKASEIDDIRIIDEAPALYSEIKQDSKKKKGSRHSQK